MDVISGDRQAEGKQQSRQCGSLVEMFGHIHSCLVIRFLSCIGTACNWRVLPEMVLLKEAFGNFGAAIALSALDFRVKSPAFQYIFLISA